MTDFKTTSSSSASDSSSNAGGGFRFVIPPHPNTTFDESEFLQLLEASISLSIQEKQNVIDAIPRLEQSKIDELFAIFREEQAKFAKLEEKFGDDIVSLKEKRIKELEQEKSQKIEEQESSQDQEEAERIKRELGL